MNKKGAMLFGVLMGLVWFLIGIFLISESMSKTKEPICNNSVSADKMKSNEVYLIDNLVVIDSYAYRGEHVANKKTNSNVTDNYYMCFFYDGNNNPCVASLSVNVNDEISDELIDYCEDEIQGLGDCVLHGYFTANEINDKQLVAYYAEGTDMYNSLLTEFYGIKMEVLQLDFDYKYSADVDYMDMMAGEKKSQLFMGIVFSILGGGWLMFLLYKDKKDKQAAEHQEAMRQYYLQQMQQYAYSQYESGKAGQTTKLS